MDWSISAARLSVFFPEPANIESNSWWSDVFGSPPDNSEIRRAQAIRIDGGRIGDRSFVLQISPLRCDWQIIHANAAPLTRFDPIGTFPEAADLLRKHFVEWLRALPFATRIAVGIQAQINAQNRVEAYKILQGKLPGLDLDPDKSREFLFRINRPRKLKFEAEEFNLNRISTWSASSMTLVVQPVQAQPSPTANIDLGLVTSCELDISSDEGRTTNIGPERRVQLLEAALDNGQEILEKGDIA